MANDLKALQEARDTLLAWEPSYETWERLARVINDAWALAPETLASEWVPLLEERLGNWPPGLRNAPGAWLEGEGVGRAPLLATADTFDAARQLKPAARRQFVDRLVAHVPGAASKVLTYFVRVEDRTMMKQLVDFGALSVPAIISALREPDGTEKRYESMAEFAKQLGSVAREAADALADRAVEMRARRPSQKTTPALQRLVEALLGCDAPVEPVSRALTPLLDYPNGALRKLARKELEARGLSAPQSVWEQCSVGWPVIAELQRLGCQFNPRVYRPERMQSPAGEVEVPLPFRYLFAVEWPRGRLRGNEWMFGSDAHSEISVDFGPPHFLDMEAYEKRPYVEMATDGCGGYYYHISLLDLPAQLGDEGLANIPVYRLERGGRWHHPRGPAMTTLQTFLSNLSRP
ncbi:hypothetical protein [Hyalangium rubrum]|uniref:Uncharacterized protein n=1 Tax=Hyalangium rubrum TaxID=3103134 RepID=A0ABU5HHA7_9BACT|nr:hypothetical protein [Hyalangium sp. s54d21]MDY7232736.1 hypothetical protein [Hyalangium sp. s54d21]